MKKRLYLLICCVSFLIVDYTEILHAQGASTVVYDPAQYPGYPVKTIYIPVTKSDKDSIPMHLIQAVQSADILSPSVIPATLYWQGEGPPHYYWGEQYPPYVYDWILPLGTFTVWFAPACGDSFHENGQLSSSIECVDSVMHGKAFFWDETGHKTSESTYSEGYQIKQKIYDNRGRITSVTHFDYQGQYHGICIYYNYYEESNTKSVSRYKHGTLDGWQEEYTNGILTTKTNYKSGEAIREQSFYPDGNLKRSLIKLNGYVLSDYELNTNGDTVFFQRGNEMGQILFIKRWCDDGRLYQNCPYVNGKPHGTWLLDYNASTGISQMEKYDHGVKVLFLISSDEQPFHKQEFENGIQKTQTIWNEEGDTTYHKILYSDGQIEYEKKWNERGFVQHEYRTEKDSVSCLMTGTGYYILYDTLYTFTVEEKPWNYYVSRYVIWKDDTIRTEYCMNQGAPNEYQHILGVNHFVQRNGESIKNGEWKYYSNNNLDSVITYQNGIRNGRAVYYSSEENSVELQSFGSYKNDLKEGEWTFLTNKIENTEQSISERQSAPFFADAKDSVITTFVNDVANGPYKLYNGINGCLIEGNIVNGLADGVWVYYDQYGKVIQKMNYKKGTLSKKKQDTIALNN